MNDSVGLVQDNVSRKFYLQDANKFSKTLKNADEVFVGFIEAIDASGECHFTHRTAYGDVLETVVKERSEALLDEMQTCYPSIFKELMYPITQNHVLSSMPLVDEKLPPAKRKLYPLSELEVKEQHE